MVYTLIELFLGGLAESDEVWEEITTGESNTWTEITTDDSDTWTEIVTG